MEAFAFIAAYVTFMLNLPQKQKKRSDDDDELVFYIIPLNIM